MQRCSDDGEPVPDRGPPDVRCASGRGSEEYLRGGDPLFWWNAPWNRRPGAGLPGAVQEGLKNSVIVEKCPGVELKIHTDYNGIGKIQYITAQMEIPVLDTQYTDAVDVVCMVPLERRIPGGSDHRENRWKSGHDPGKRMLLWLCGWRTGAVLNFKQKKSLGLWKKVLQPLCVMLY